MGFDDEPFYTFAWYTLGKSLRATWRAEAEGLEHVPDEGAAIMASNHLSYLDHFLMPAVVPRQIYFISKDQHFDVPIQRWVFRQAGVIPLARGEGDEEAFQRALGVLEAGDLLGIYPEGTRSLDGKLHKGHTGVARLALAAGVPIVPIGMIGTFEALPKGSRLPKFPKVTVRFGEPLDYPDHHGEQEDYDLARKITDEVMMAIAELSGQDYVDEYTRNPEYVPAAERDGS